MPVICFLCNKVFTEQRNLNRHVRNIHRRTPEVISYKSEVYINKCLEGCGSFKDIKDLRYHLESAHEFNSNKETLSFNCKNGEYQINFLTIIYHHCDCEYPKKLINQYHQSLYNLYHTSLVCILIIIFFIFSDFENWLENTCRQGDIRYVHKTSKRTNNTTLMYYYCNRSGKELLLITA